MEYTESMRMMRFKDAAMLTALMAVIECIAVASFAGIVDLGKETDAVGLAVVTTVVVAACLMGALLRMTVRVDEDGVSVKTLRTRMIRFEEIASVAVRDRTYAVGRYGGWGLRLWIRGTGYVSPECEGGVEILFPTGRGVMISSRDPERLMEAIARRRARSRSAPPQQPAVSRMAYAVSPSLERGS